MILFDQLQQNCICQNEWNLKQIEYYKTEICPKILIFQRLHVNFNKNINFVPMPLSKLMLVQRNTPRMFSPPNFYSPSMWRWVASGCSQSGSMPVHIDWLKSTMTRTARHWSDDHLGLMRMAGRSNCRRLKMKKNSVWNPPSLGS